MAAGGECTRLSAKPRLQAQSLGERTDGDQMAVSEHKVSSPDGRMWSVKTSLKRRSLTESGQVPYFWAHVIVTAILIVVCLFILESEAFKMLSILIAAVFVIWLVGFLNSMFRTTVSADTEGPPVDHRLWVVVKRRRQKRCFHELENAIHAGKDVREPEGTFLKEI